MRPRKIDEIQPSIVTALRAVGCSVLSLASLGKGVPDLLVAYKGLNFLIEVKSASGTFTPDQTHWHSTWHSPVYIVRSATEALELIKELRK